MQVGFQSMQIVVAAIGKLLSQKAIKLVWSGCAPQEPAQGFTHGRSSVALATCANEVTYK